jgi:hypothetical protein
MTTNYNVVLHIHCSQTLKPEEINFLSLLLLNSKFTDSFSLNRSLIDLSFVTRVKKRFSSHGTNLEKKPILNEQKKNYGREKK